MEPETIESEGVQPSLAVVTSDRSAQVGDLMVAMAKAQGEYDHAVKDSANPYYGSKYADLASITGAVRGAFSKHGIAIVQTVTADLERQTAGATTFLYFGDQWVSTSCELPAVGKSKDGKDRFDAQTIGAAQTYARRYTLAPLASVAPEDDDGNTIVRDDARKFGNAEPKRQQQRTTPAQATAPASSEPAVQRAGFFAKAKEMGWGLNDIKKLIVQSYPDAGGSTAKLTDEQLADLIKVMGEWKQPAEFFAATEKGKEEE